MKDRKARYRIDEIEKKLRYFTEIERALYITNQQCLLKDKLDLLYKHLKLDIEVVENKKEIRVCKLKKKKEVKNYNPTAKEVMENAWIRQMEQQQGLAYRPFMQ